MSAPTDAIHLGVDSPLEDVTNIGTPHLQPHDTPRVIPDRDGRGVGHLHGLVSLGERQASTAIVRLLGLDLAGLADDLDDPLRGAFATVVTVEAPRVELVALEAALERPPEHVVEVETAALLVDDLLGIFDGHHLRTVPGLQEAHALGGRSVEQPGENGSLVEATDVDRVGHGNAFSTSQPGMAVKRVFCNTPDEDTAFI